MSWMRTVRSWYEDEAFAPTRPRLYSFDGCDGMRLAVGPMPMRRIKRLLLRGGTEGVGFDADATGLWSFD